MPRHQGMVANETLAYFMARTYLFLLRVGCLAEHVRFRQHLPDEMAHYGETTTTAAAAATAITTTTAAAPAGRVQGGAHRDGACHTLPRRVRLL